MSKQIQKKMEDIQVGMSDVTEAHIKDVPLLLSDETFSFDLEVKKPDTRGCK